MIKHDLQPRVSVVMPVYNAARFLEEAVRSILGQTFSDLELIIIDDGSTDDSLSILKAITDERICVFCNDCNLGVSASLNRGISVARGEYIARMDADDISFPCRIEKQVKFLDAHLEVSVVGVKCCLVDVEGKEVGLWRNDSETVSASEIRGMLPICNCIAHPGIMMRRKVATAFLYRTEQDYEDYDLWLRLSAAGHRLEKLDEVLLKYRVHPSSVTAKTNSLRQRFNNAQTKYLFLLDHVRKRLPINGFVCRVATETAREFVAQGVGKISDAAHSLARRLLRQTGRCLGAALQVQNASGLYFFFPYYHVGGAERVHADILAAVTDCQPWVFFTNRSKNDAFLGLFTGKGRLFNLAFLLENVLSKHIAAGVLIRLINRHPGVTVFGVNSSFFYDLIPFLSPAVRCIDLIHAFGGGVEDVSIPLVGRLDGRVAISQKTVHDLRRQYQDYCLPEKLLDRVTVITNAVDVPDLVRSKGMEDKLRVIFVGRDAVEKRVRLAATIAQRCDQSNVAASFRFIGDFSQDLRNESHACCEFSGEIASYQELVPIYEAADILIVTSDREGVPMVMMEAMAHGVVPICTNVGGISWHISHGVNGFLVAGNLEDDTIVSAFVEHISMLTNDRNKLRIVSGAAREYSAEHFSRCAFRRSYRQLLGLTDLQE